ncbi:ring-cleaving dioxygenase [Loigolactobacillus jiayinensis]|uniref:Ring-cleaving dioxygenase n=1 Tax=Loigolactobacillus jiayinensis TaxID=2486016 RepID=A0ABW1REA9_9LACO|nr:ring-cleaving dioxygenase [Loigolactobacillus jiayinensis]
MAKLLGLHHLTAITSSSPKMFNFMSGILGLHLIKKTVNQDDIRTYHLYFTDDRGAAGTDITFFDFPGQFQGNKGRNSIERIGFRVPNDAALAYWQQRFTDHQIEHEPIVTEFGAKTLRFYDFDHERYQLVSDEVNHGVPAGTPYRDSPVPAEFAISGLGPMRITVNYFTQMEKVLIDLLGFEKVATEGQQTLYEVDSGGHGAQVIVADEQLPADEVQAYGTVHHLAFRTADEKELRDWIEKITAAGLRQSGFVDRFYFKSEYFRPGPGVLFEIATDGPGFLVDETYEEAGVHLELPPFLEAQRADIEAHLVPFNTDKKVVD